MFFFLQIATEIQIVSLILSDFVCRVLRNNFFGMLFKWITFGFE